MKKIPLSRGMFALVDDSDYERVIQFKWCVDTNDYKRFYAKHGYAYKNGKRPCIKLHHFLIGRIKGKEVDHIDGNGLNNQRNNLRFCTRTQNAWNTRGYLGRKLPKGVYPSLDKFQSQLRINNRKIYLGRFETKQRRSP